jgi:hypothetical protein
MSREANPYDEGMGSSETMDDVKERAVNAASRLKDKASQIGNNVSQTIDRQRENAAKGLDRAASTLHDGVGSAAKVGHGVADGMESTASYLRTHNVGDIGSDVIGICKRHPAQALISAAVVGFLVGRAGRR